MVAGFTFAAGFNIVSTQLNPFFGIKRKASNFLEAITQFIEYFGENQRPDWMLGLGTSVFLLALRVKQCFLSSKTSA